ncbi:hypothetical protein BCR34DRAFT_599636 [Clohesyomyces aquaticus]|uniref:Uncharacterized protein n=1 Tax=Clohesyomyces aquaticus TaxID=1231657 RepID=A0A1Y1ZUD4_9PLEO|nr:hypothetical protein BCR34DRAFT_599636 [Clohesyomyces aquaticus]
MYFPSDYNTFSHVILSSYTLIFLLLIAIFFIPYSFFIGFTIPRLFYYRGALGPNPKRYNIKPHYTPEEREIAARQRERRERRAARRAARLRKNGDGDAHSIGNSTLTSDSLFAATNILNDEPVDRDANIDIEDLDPQTASPTLIAQTIKDDRISRLPHFEADDCGDGHNFPGVEFADPVLVNAALANGPFPLETPTEDPYPHPEFRDDPGPYMRMGLKRLDQENWLTVDHTYQKWYEARKEILKNLKEEVLQTVPENCEPGVEAACAELMWQVVGFLTERYPKYFEIVEGKYGAKSVRNRLVGEEFRLMKPWDVEPLEVCARLAMEDFNLLRQSEFTGRHHLVASATLFPAGWSLPERIGASIMDLHGPVPQWDSKLGRSAEQYFVRISPTSPMERSTFFIQTNPSSFPLREILFIQSGKNFFPGNRWNLVPDDILIRRERQTFRRLPKSDMIVFTVKTSLENLTDLSMDERPKLVKEIKAWPEDIAVFKGRDIWARAVIGFCEGRTRFEREDRDLSTVGSLTMLDGE